MREPNKVLPYRYYFIPTFLFCLAGVLVTSYLTYHHYRNYTDTTYASFCAISKAINCDTVSQSPWSVVGGLPVALWGLFGYLLFLLLLYPLKDRDNFPLWRLLFLLGCLYSLTSVFFAYISATQIHSFCILCIASTAISLALLFQSWLICRRFRISPFFTTTKTLFSLVVSRKNIYGSIIVLFSSFLLLEIFLPHYWELETTEMPENIARGLTDNGHPWIGAENPKLTIEVFSDYQCFQCLKMQRTLRQLVAEHPEKIRLVHRHYPMDNEFNPLIVPEPFHVGSGKMALLAIYAISKGKFWQMNDLLYELGRSKKPFNIKKIAMEIDIPSGELAWALQAEEVKEILRRDIWMGMKLRITGTPGFVINNEVYAGTIPPEVIKEALQ